jgi:hypothetical protein
MIDKMTTIEITGCQGRPPTKACFQCKQKSAEKIFGDSGLP